MVTAQPEGKIYGSPDPALTWFHGSLQNGDTDSVFSGALVRNAGENTGTYTVNQGTLSAGINYIINYNAGDGFVISPYTLTVLADSQNKVYGSADPLLTYTHAALQNGDTDSVFTGGLYRVPGENVIGHYDINQGTLSAGSNYAIDYTGSHLVITPYTLTVTADAERKICGTVDPLLTYTYGTLQNGDTGSVFTGDLVRDVGENVGAYAINQGTLSAGGNYAIDYTGNLLTITSLPPPLTTISVFKISSPGRPIISVADQVIDNDPSFEPIDVSTPDNANVSLLLAPAAPAISGQEGLAGVLSAIMPAGGGAETGAAVNSDIHCANAFLDNKPCNTIQILSSAQE